MRRIEHLYGGKTYGIFEIILDDYHVLRILPAEIAGVSRMADSSHQLRILEKLNTKWVHKYSASVNRGQMEKIKIAITQAIVEADALSS